MEEYNEEEAVTSELAKPFRETIPSRIGAELFDLQKHVFCWEIAPMRLLLMIAQEYNYLGSEKSLKTERVWNVSDVYKALRIEDAPRRHIIVADLIDKVTSLKVTYKKYKQDGSIISEGINIFEYAKFDSTQRLCIKITRSALPYLCEFNRFSQILPINYLKLNNSYKLWFYMYFHLWAKTGKIQVALMDLISTLGLDNKNSYTRYNTIDGKSIGDKNWKDNFCKVILGIVRPKGWKYKPKGKNENWEYLKDSEGNEIGTLATISKETDLTVNAYAYKSANTVYIDFVIERKETSRKLQELVSNDTVTKNDGKLDSMLPIIDKCFKAIENPFKGIEVPMFADKKILSKLNRYYTCDVQDINDTIQPEITSMFKRIDEGSIHPDLLEQLYGKFNEHEEDLQPMAYRTWLLFNEYKDLLYKYRNMSMETFCNLEKIANDIYKPCSNVKDPLALIMSVLKK